MQNTELGEIRSPASVSNILVDNGEFHHRESDLLLINEAEVAIQGLTPGLSRASELQQRMTKVIKTLKLNIKDHSNEAAYFGFLQFTYSNNANKNVDDTEENDCLSSFVHLAASTRPWSLAKLIEAYQLRAPDFILSIQTGNVYDNDPHKQKSGIQTETERAIQHGLTDTARITHPWVTTSCINQDVIKLLGNALHRDICGRDVPCLGFCSWNYVPGDHQPVKQSSTTSTFCEMRYSMDNEHPPIHKYMMTPSANCDSLNSQGQLEPSHTHFFFFDDGSKDVKNMLLKRQEVEHELSISKVLRSPISGFQEKNAVSDSDIPIIMLLIGGDFATLAATCKGLAVGTPVVVVRNTGGIADIVAQLCRKLSPTDELAQFRKSIYIEECKKELKKLCLKENDAREQNEEIGKYVDVLNEMEELIIVFDAIEYNAKLEDTIADAILTGIKYQNENWGQFFGQNTKAALLLWCAVWGKDEYARELLTDRKAETAASANNAEQDKNQVISLAQQILFEALHRNTVPFVSLLMEYGASIEELTEEQLIIICIKTMNDDALVLNKSHVNFTSVKRDAKLSELKKYVEQRYNGYLRQYLNHYVTKENDREKKRTKGQLVREPIGEQKVSASFTPLSKIFDGRKTEALYLWFVFMNQPAMAKYLCSRSRNQTVASLLAAEIYAAAANTATINKQSLRAISE
ncbi:unnamed protein product [Rotaria socialis]|uniref:TRPM SLOG domain-containing protein n=1 Tax=Rotaria socialis TaxID=392032 RepID=A0A821B0Z0_9BILA|nr:unnamed protein product [Rotaria socialis]